MFKTTNTPRGYAASPHVKEGWVRSCAWLPTHQPSLGLILMTLLINSAFPVNENSYKTHSQQPSHSFHSLVILFLSQLLC